MQTNKSKHTKLPESAVKYLNRNYLFNSFGLVNIKVIQSHIWLYDDVKIPEDELKQLIHTRFDNEMVTGKVEFLKNK